MEIAQLYKSTYNTQFQQSMHPCHISNMSQIWQVNTLLQSQSQRSHHDAHPHPQPMSLLSVNLLHLMESKK